ncbi:MAG TPA: hypothetical protein ENJ01_00070 [Gammaproteobacteria bacterium]|nr:hypothetical protein [Gammaproteobacteria bacterium]
MTTVRQALIAREGQPLVWLLAVALVMLGWFGLWWLFAPLLIACLAVLWIYRQPHRDIPAAPLGLLAPVDGRITRIARGHDPYLEREAWQVTLAMSAAGTGVVRSVTEGKVMHQWLDSNGARCARACLAHHVQTDEGDDVVVRLQRGRLLGRLYSNLVNGERVGQGERYGFIPLGREVDVWLPANVKLLVTEGQRVQGGIDVLAELVRA